MNKTCFAAKGTRHGLAATCMQVMTCQDSGYFPKFKKSQGLRVIVLLNVTLYKLLI